MKAVWVLNSVYSIAPGQIANGIEILSDHDQMVVQNADMVKAAVAHCRKHPTLRETTAGA